MYLKFSTTLFLIAIFFFSDLKGQVRYDTSVIKTEPCTVKKISLEYDTFFQVKGDTFYKRDVCRVKLEWPVFRGCGESKNDSALNSYIKDTYLTLLPYVNLLDIDKISDKIISRFCGIKKAMLGNEFTLKRFDNRFLSISIIYSCAYPAGTTGSDRASINYDLKKQKIIELSDLFKPNCNYQGIIKDLKKIDSNRSLVLKNYFINKKNKLIIYGISLSPAPLRGKVVLRKEDLKSCLREEYYND